MDGRPDPRLPGIFRRADERQSGAQDFVVKAYNGQEPISRTGLGEGGFVAEMPVGAVITFRPAGQASWRTEPSTASVDIKDDKLIELNGGNILKLKFPKR
jgi:filamentous hemagglutinin